MGRNKQDIFIKEINLKDYFQVLRNRFWMIFTIMAITVLAGIIYSYLTGMHISYYQTSTRIIVNSDDDNMKTLMVMIKDPSLMEKVKAELRLDRSPEDIASQIEVSRIDESRVIRISVTDKDPKLAADIANVTARVFKNGAMKVLVLDFNEIELLSAAKENPIPINKSENFIIKISIVLGLLFGVGFAFLMDSLDSSIRTENEVENILGVPVIGVISNMNKKRLLSEKKNDQKIGLSGETVDIK